MEKSVAIIVLSGSDTPRVAASGRSSACPEKLLRLTALRFAYFFASLAALSCLMDDVHIGTSPPRTTVSSSSQKCDRLSGRDTWNITSPTTYCKKKKNRWGSCLHVFVPSRSTTCPCPSRFLNLLAREGMCFFFFLVVFRPINGGYLNSPSNDA